MRLASHRRKTRAHAPPRTDGHAEKTRSRTALVDIAPPLANDAEIEVRPSSSADFETRRFDLALRAWSIGGPGLGRRDRAMTQNSGRQAG
jgi:hypothetical protein